MLSPRLAKTLRDLWANKARTVLVILAIAIGIFGVGSILTAYSILTREIDRNYMETNPASAVLTVTNLDETLVERVQARPDMADVEVRRMVTSRIQTGENEWRTIHLFVIDDFDNLRVNQFYPERGEWNPGTGEILLERSGLQVINDDVGDTALVKTPNGTPTELAVTGIVHDPGQAPGWMEGWAYGYITLDTLILLGEEPFYDELRIVVSENATNADTIRTTAFELRDWMQTQGYTVTQINVPPPGEHPHHGQMQSLLFMLEAFGVLALILSGVLVATMISAVMAQQLRQIGVMKAVGARTRQIIGIYLNTVLILGTAALLIGLPAGLIVGRLYAGFTADMLNFTIQDSTVPYWVYLVQIAAGLSIPALTAIYPIVQGSRYTVREAVNDYGVNPNQFGSRPVDRLLSRIQGLGRITLLSLRNTFRRQGRLTLTVFTLAAGGAVFMGAVNLYNAWQTTVSGSYDNRHYDIELWLKEPVEQQRIEEVIAPVEGVARVESWGQTEVSLVYEDGTNSNLFNMTAPPVDTTIMDFEVIEGRWLEPNDTNAVVINHTLEHEETSIHVGDDIVLNLDGEARTWHVVGFIRELGSFPTAYVSYDYFATLTGQEGLAQNVKVSASGNDPAKVTQRLEAALATSDLGVYQLRELAVTKKSFLDHIVVLMTFLTAMALLVAAVGGLGLMSTMSLNVLERMREIGIMRAIGASMDRILQIVLVEGIFIGILSWGLALLLSMPITAQISKFSGEIFLQTGLDTVYSLFGMGLWLAIVILVSAAASLYPAWQASELPVNEILAYE
ncbi:MAG TPA: FtsX-like permease family protein [Aggregatilineaceae bacterium]|nr:FtsX-like permease family protein [Aggregatilineaceae bacterium]